MTREGTCRGSGLFCSIWQCWPCGLLAPKVALAAKSTGSSRTAFEFEFEFAESIEVHGQQDSDTLAL